MYICIQIRIDIRNTYIYIYIYYMDNVYYLKQSVGKYVSAIQASIISTGHRTMSGKGLSYL